MQLHAVTGAAAVQGPTGSPAQSAHCCHHPLLLQLGQTQMCRMAAVGCTSWEALCAGRPAVTTTGAGVVCIAVLGPNWQCGSQIAALNLQGQVQMQAGTRHSGTKDRCDVSRT